MLFWQLFLARLSKAHSSFPQEHFQSLYFCMKTQTPILSFGKNQNKSFIARSISARLPKLHSRYAEEELAEDEFNWNKYKVIIKFKKWANKLSQWCQNCIEQVQTDILVKINSFEGNLILQLIWKVQKMFFFWMGGQKCILLLQRKFCVKLIVLKSSFCS